MCFVQSDGKTERTGLDNERFCYHINPRGYVI